MTDKIYEGKQFFDRQLQTWELAQKNFSDLAKLQIKEFVINGIKICVQFNPARAISTCAKLDKASLEKRPCFLCTENKPAEQASITIQLDEPYSIRVNPYPILPGHLTISSIRHQPQCLAMKADEQLPGRLLQALERYFGTDYAIFYNGAACGASAPDHFHFQAAPMNTIPMIRQWKEILKGATMQASKTSSQGVICKHLIINHYVCTLHAFVSTSSYESDPELLHDFLSGLPVPEGEMEPRYNLFAWKEENQFITVYIPRKKHRPDCYYATDSKQLLISPGALDMAGIIVTPRQEDFEKITETDILSIYKETGW